MRKKPQQQRSRQMVDTLIDATARCIAKRGLDGTTTPAIAELAGVSVGSLYQYFSSKEQLIDALLEKIVSDVTLTLGKHVPAATVSDFRTLTHMAIRVGMGFLHSNEGLYLELVRNWYRLPTHKVVDVLQSHFLEFARYYFLKHHNEIPVKNLHVKFFIIINSTLFTLVRFLNQQSPLLKEDELVDELTDMIAKYLES